jgi:hypothetical protein
MESGGRQSLAPVIAMGRRVPLKLMGGTIV